MYMAESNVVQILWVVVAFILPAIVALVTKRWADSGLKGLVLLALAALQGFFSELLDALITALPFEFKQIVWNTIVTFVVAVASHYGLLKPLHITGTNGAIATRTAEIGVGGRHRAPE
jgi:uncharacterized membrane protein YhaH (DUF805 family)